MSYQNRSHLRYSLTTALLLILIGLSPSNGQAQPAAPANRQGMNDVPQPGAAEVGGALKLPGLKIGAFKVSSTGASTYTIPIAVPPGTNGMAPNLSLAYNSQGENGLLGMGWSLAGLPAIHRCPRTVAQDGFRGGVNYDANDRFCLDGQRL